MMTYHKLICVMEFLREQDVSQDTLDRVLSALWEETEARRTAEEAPAEVPALPV